MSRNRNSDTKRSSPQDDTLLTLPQGFYNGKKSEEASNRSASPAEPTNDMRGQDLWNLCDSKS